IRLPEDVIIEWEGLDFHINYNGDLYTYIEYQSPYEKVLEVPAGDHQELIKEVERYLHWLLFPGRHKYAIKVCEPDQECEIDAGSGDGYFEFKIYDSAGRLLFTGAVDGILDKEERAGKALYVYYPRDIWLIPIKQ
ncbi:MAG: hypothetical protein JHC33_13850, partial [Ignisphaera sp.]|nr:hypothetical protein [Ignisphaera sp.]